MKKILFLSLSAMLFSCRTNSSEDYLIGSKLSVRYTTKQDHKKDFIISVTYTNLSNQNLFFFKPRLNLYINNELQQMVLLEKASSFSLDRDNSATRRDEIKNSPLLERNLELGTKLKSFCAPTYKGLDSIVSANYLENIGNSIFLQKNEKVVFNYAVSSLITDSTINGKFEFVSENISETDKRYVDWRNAVHTPTVYRAKHRPAQ